jgi:hypothetical protein
MSAPDWAWTHVGTGPQPEQDLSFLCPRVPRPGCGQSGPYAEGSRTRPGGPSCTCEGPGPCSGSPVYTYRCPTLSHVVWTHCWHLGVYRFFWPHGDPGTIHVVESGAVHYVTRDSRVGTASSCCIKGYPYFRVPTVAPGPTSGEDTSLQVGQKLVPCVSLA